MKYPGWRIKLEILISIRRTISDLVLRILAFNGETLHAPLWGASPKPGLLGGDALFGEQDFYGMLVGLRSQRDLVLLFIDSAHPKI